MEFFDYNNIERIYSVGVEEKLGPDPCNEVFGVLDTSKDKNHQICVVTDCQSYDVKVYKHDRTDEDSPWDEWMLVGTIR